MQDRIGQDDGSAEEQKRGRGCCRLLDAIQCDRARAVCVGGRSLAYLRWRNDQYFGYSELMPVHSQDGRVVLDFGLDLPALAARAIGPHSGR